MNTVEFLDAVKKRHALASDYALAKFLGWSTSRVAQYRSTPRELDDEGCVQIAESLELPVPYVMACIAAARAKDAGIKKHWLAAARLLKTGTAAAILVTAGLLSQPAPSSASPAAAVKLTPYTLCAHRRRRLAARTERLTPRTLRRRRRKKRSVIVAADNYLPLGNTAAG